MTGEAQIRVPDDPEAEIRCLAAIQRSSAADLLGACIKAREAGVTWQRIGVAAGVCAPTVLRQVAARSPVVVVRPTHHRQDGARG